MSELPPRSSKPGEAGSALPAGPGPAKSTAGTVAEPDPDATVRLPPGPSPSEPDPDATVSLPPRPAPIDPDPDATVRLAFEDVAAAPGADETLPPLGHIRVAEPDPDATVRLENIPAPELEAVVARQAVEPDPDTTLPPLTPLAPLPASRDVVTKPVPSVAKRSDNPFAPKAQPDTVQSNLGTLGGLNSLIAAANPILCAVPHIRYALQHPDPADLRDSLQDLVEAFEASASSAGTPKETIDAAIYALCALVDESAAATPWGGDWAKTGLLQKMRGDKHGEEGFFAILDKASTNPEANSDLLEFLYVCLALGYEGRYRGLGGGKAALDQVRANLHALVARLRGLPVDGLSETWRGIAAPPAVPVPGRRAPLGMAVGAVLALAVLYLVYDVSRESPSSKVPSEFAKQKPAVVAETVKPAVVAETAKPAVVAETAKPAAVAETAPAVAPIVTPPPALQSAPAPVEAGKIANAADSAPKTDLAPKERAPVESAKAPTAAPVPAAPPMLAQQLAEEIGRGEVTLSVEGGRSTIIIRVVNQFASGGTQPQATVRPIIEKLATVLNSAPGTIVVTAHTDALPIKSARFPSNLELSAARATSVAKLISAKLSDRERIKTVGAGDAEPIAPNDTEENRAKNRRVVIDLTTAP